MSGWMGIDLSQFDLDEPIGDVESNAIQSTVETFKKASGDSESEWTVRKLAEWVGVGGFGPVIIGSGETVAKELVRIQDETDVDGFNLAYAITPGTRGHRAARGPGAAAAGPLKTSTPRGPCAISCRPRDHLPRNHYGASFALRNRVGSDRRPKKPVPVSGSRLVVDASGAAST